MGTPIVNHDRVLVTISTVSTAIYQLGAALPGWLAPSADGAVSGERVPYVVQDSLTAPTMFEVGEGVYTAGSPATITRALVHRNHSGTQSAVSWPAGTRYLFLAASAERLALLDTDGKLPFTAMPNLAGNVMVGLSGAWPDTNIDPGTSETAVFSGPIPVRTRSIRGVARITGDVGTLDASLLPRVYLINASGGIALPALTPSARGAANGYIDCTFPFSFDLAAGVVGNSSAWTLRFNASRNNPVSMLEYTYNGIAICDAA